MEATRKQMEVLRAQRSAAEGTVKADRAQLEQPRLNLSYTRILAPWTAWSGSAPCRSATTSPLAPR